MTTLTLMMIQIIISSGVQSGIPIVAAGASSSGAPMTATGRDQNKLQEDILKGRPVRSRKQALICREDGNPI